MLKRDQGKYGAMIFDKPEFSPTQPPILIKDKRLQLWSEGCGYPSLTIQNHYKIMLERYQQNSSEHMVGLADVKMESYMYFIGITALPCLKVQATPLIIKSWAKVPIKK